MERNGHTEGGRILWQDKHLPVLLQAMDAESLLPISWRLVGDDGPPVPTHAPFGHPMGRMTLSDR